MKLARVQIAEHVFIAVVTGDGIIDLSPLGPFFNNMLDIIEGGKNALDTIAEFVQNKRAVYLLDEVSFLAPIPRPGKVLAIGMNYIKHEEEAEKLGIGKRAMQTWFNKQSTCISGPFDEIDPGVTVELDYEVELGAVIGKRSKHLDENNALDAIFGYLVINDVSARDWQLHTPTFTMGKSFDTHGPTGPWIVTADEVGDPQNLALRCFVNGELRQENNTANMIHSITDQLIYLTTAFTLEPGDIIATGTPEGVGFAKDPPVFLQPGDVVRCEIDGIGAIENRVGPKPSM